jgi:hypothetical protein
MRTSAFLLWPRETCAARNIIREDSAGTAMDALTTNETLTLFGKWERENMSIVLLFSTPSEAMSFKKGRMVPFLDSCLFLAFGDDNILRIFLQEAKFWRLDQTAIPEESRKMAPKFEQCVRVVSETLEYSAFCAPLVPRFPRKRLAVREES